MTDLLKANPTPACIRAFLKRAIFDFRERGLTTGSTWAAELLAGMPASSKTDIKEELRIKQLLKERYDTREEEDSDEYLLGRCYFENREYKRCVHTLTHCTGQKALFLRNFAKLMSVEQERHYDAIQSLSMPRPNAKQNDILMQIIRELEPLYEKNELDGFNCYMYGIVLKKQSRPSDAFKVLLKSIELYPCNWNAWSEMIDIIEGHDAALVLFRNLPDIFLTDLFKINVAIRSLYEITQINDSMEKSAELFPTSNQMLTNYALVAYLLHDTNAASEAFSKLRKKDPFQLEHMDIYSDILFVTGDRVTLSNLACECMKIEKYRFETCIVVGNYYACIKEHQKALEYFNRALKLNHKSASTLIVMGHEYLEISNTHAAIECYRRAIDIDPREFRAWYGLGQTYAMMLMHDYAIYYYQRAAAIDAKDVRTWLVMGECHEYMNRHMEAIECYKRAMFCQMDEMETMKRLADAYQYVQRYDDAAYYYKKIITYEHREPSDVEIVAEAYICLAKYETRKGNYRQANEYINQLFGLGTTSFKNEAHLLLREIQKYVPL